MSQRTAWIVGGVVVAVVVVSLMVQQENEAARQRSAVYAAELEAYNAQTRQQSVDACEQAVFEDYKARWEKTCRALDQWSDCQLPRQTARDYGDDLERARNRCQQRYGGLR